MITHLRWWLWACLSIVVLALAGMLGFFGALHESDVTYIGFVIIAMYVLATVWMGYKLYVGNRDFDFILYLTEIMEKLGLVGTVIGLIISFTALYGIDLANVDQAKALLVQVVIGVLTALYTTLVGLVASMFLKTQVSIVEMLGRVNESSSE